MDDTKRTQHVQQRLFERCAQRIQQIIPEQSRVCVALSGGLDSVVLLHLFAQLRNHYQLTAVHVHHGLSAHADQWADFCQSLCSQLDISLSVEHVHIARNDPSGIEAAARHARYQAISRQASEYIALAHHRDDQAETLLLQLLRGAGLKGLSAMPRIRKTNSVTHIVRPLLDIERSELKQWALENNIRWVEDESNQDTRYARNFLRHQVFPLIAQQYPAWRNTLTRSVTHIAESSQLLDELAYIDADNAMTTQQLAITQLTRLSDARARNLLRFFIGQQGLSMPNQRKLDELLRQIIHSGRDNHLNLLLGDFMVRRHHQHIWLVRNHPLPNKDLQWAWQGEHQLALPELDGILHFIPSAIGGLKYPQDGRLVIQLRQGGERFQPDCRRPRRELKKLLQESSTPPWQRQRTPLIWHHHELVHVINVGTACTWHAQPGENGLRIEWQENTSIEYRSDD